MGLVLGSTMLRYLVLLVIKISPLVKCLWRDNVRVRLAQSVPMGTEYHNGNSDSLKAGVALSSSTPSELIVV